MRPINIGREVVSNILRGKEPALKQFLEAGFDLEWLTDENDLSRAAIFNETDLQAYTFIIRHFLEKRAVPTTAYFQYSYPAEAYRLSNSGMTTAEILYLAKEDRLRVNLEVSGSEFADRMDAGEYPEAAEVLRAAAKVRDARESSVHVVWDSDEWDYEARINRKVQQGVVTGIPELDAGFMGWQPGDLVCYLGRPKAGKTSCLLLSALATYQELEKKILFVTVEVAAGDDVQRPGIADKLDAFNAGISYNDYARGALNDGGRAAEKLVASRERLGSPQEFHIVQPTGTYTILDLENDIERFEPDVVYVDGFYLMTDTTTGKSGGNWEGHDNLARVMKFMAARRNLVIITSMQVRGKQLSGKKKDIDNDAMMGGTGLVMWSTMVLGVNIDEEHSMHTINCTASRIGYLPTIHGTWDWDTCAFQVDADYEIEGI